MLYCYECGKEITEKNVGENGRNVICSDCLQRKVNFIKMLERETGLKINNKHDLVVVYKEWTSKDAKKGVQTTSKSAQEGQKAVEIEAVVG